MFILYALFCGCVPVIYPIKDMSRSEYVQNFFFGVSEGLAYGNTDEEKEFALGTLEIAKQKFLKIFEEDEINLVYSFLKDLKNNFCE
jgi:hypothetical protein